MPSNINKDTVHFVGQASAFTVGANLVNNGTFDDWDDASTPTGWTSTGTDVNREIQQQDPGNFHNGPGTGACNIWTDNNSSTFVRQSDILTVGKIYRLNFDLWINAGSIKIINYDGTSVFGVFSSAGNKTLYFTATDTTVGFKQNVTNVDVTIDNVEIVEWVGDLNAGGGCAIENFTGTLSDYMTATGGVLFNDDSLTLSADGDDLVITNDGPWGITIVPGTLVNLVFSDNDPYADGVYAIKSADSTTITLDFPASEPSGDIVEVWIGGAYPDIATALNDSTLSEDREGIYRKRYICVNVDQEVDAVTDFVAETSDAAMIEDDGIRGLIGFYDKITVETAHSSYRLVSDMDYGGIYYGGAYAAFHEDESFSEVNPNRKWIELNANGNTMNILEQNSSNLQIRNFKIYNTATGASNALLHTKDVAQVYNNTFINCWFGTADLLTVNAGQILGSVFSDCYFDDAILTANLIDIFNCQFMNCIANGGTKAAIFTESNRNHWSGCLFYKGQRAMLTVDNLPFFDNCIFAEQTVAALTLDSSASQIVITNCIFSPAAVDDYAVEITTGGSISFGSANNIMYSVSGGGPMTNPIVHAQISPNPALPVGTIEKDPLFVNPGDGDFRLQENSPAFNAGIRGIFGGYSSIGGFGPYHNVKNEAYEGDTNVLYGGDFNIYDKK